VSPTLALSPTTYHKFRTSAFKYWWIDITCMMHVKASGGPLSECSVGDTEHSLVS